MSQTSDRRKLEADEIFRVWLAMNNGDKPASIARIENLPYHSVLYATKKYDFYMNGGRTKSSNSRNYWLAARRLRSYIKEQETKKTGFFSPVFTFFNRILTKSN